MGEKVGQTETKSVKELDGNVIFGEESLKTGGKDFHGAAPFVEGQAVGDFLGGGSFGVILLGHSFKCANKFHQQYNTANQDFKDRRTIESQPVDAGKGQEE